MSAAEDPADRARLDVWLWRARFFKTRSMATEFVTRKGVRLVRGGLGVRKIDKPGYQIAPGDVLAFASGGQAHHLQILALGVRRGPASEAVLLYNAAIDPDEVDVLR
ncbi:heat shock protein 15 [Candidatus Phycosocius bacilliformis]|jgi:ribosome-associated heat shock protein Hsp15|uniref:Heat shock protein 15 n=1 Tax=Candidatus Phycosocius bacilliformis TaxID=1445552 RepID=A0A2P2E9K4_9PROT|nr:S4 domain-containing protein [Candidatus Phycosocius bacilliformis]GBF57742.1 heat shock protein 15 [Candidatus Phycosocius bacilliformis]